MVILFVLHFVFLESTIAFLLLLLLKYFLIIVLQ